MSDVEVIPPSEWKLDKHIQELERTIKRVLGGITDEKISKASLRDQAIAYGVLVDKKQLLEGKPTEILSIEERRDLTELMPALIKEAQRRGISLTTDNAPSESTVGVKVSQKPMRGGRRTRKKLNKQDGA